MEPEGPTKICPECKSKVFEADTVCGFCGHVFAVAHEAPTQDAHATRICPECKAPVSVDATKCGICGHVFDAAPNVYAGSWPKTYYYEKWGSNGLFTQIVVVLVVFLAVGVGLVFFVRGRNPNGDLLPLVVFGAVALVAFCLIAGLFSKMAANASVTLQGDRVEWTTVTGKCLSVPNSQLTYSFETTGGKAGHTYSFGTKDGPVCLLREGLDDYDEVVSEIKARIARGAVHN